MTRDRETARRIAQEVQPLGGSVYYVGGCVRDRLLGREHDIRLILPEDISRHGAAPPLFSSLYSTRKPRLRKASRRDFLKNPRLGKKSLFPVGFCAIIDSV